MDASQQVPAQIPVRTPLRRFKSRLPEPVKASLRGSTRALGLLTAPLRSEPGFLIIGTKRGGTTSLWFALAGHPDVLPLFPPSQELKSPHYFDIHYDRGPGWYRSFFATQRQLRRRQRLSGRRVITGEASPYYLFHPLAAERIAQDLPDIKLIVSLRDPVERLWSHYHERLAGHTETLSIEEALKAEPGRLAGEAERVVAEQPDYYSFHHDMSSYLARGRYLEQLQPYLDRFGPGQLLILRAEDFYRDATGELQKVAQFLEISAFPAREAPPAHHNLLPRSSIPPEVRSTLVDYYRPHVQALQETLGRDFEWESFRS